MSLPKHERYFSQYKPHDFYWGLGIENETYIEMGKSTTLAPFVVNKQKRERYSVDYWTLYKPNVTKEVCAAWLQSLPEKENTVLKIPVLANGHTLARTDRFGEPKTTYEKVPKPNKKFCGTTLLEDLCAKNAEVFREGREVWWTLDGDTVEFMTQNFYNVQMEDVVDELLGLKTRWMDAFCAALKTLEREDGLRMSPKWPEKNYGLAVFLTNRNNIAIFNNGTYHFNLTIPTLLDKEARIANMTQFRARHQSAARLFQWISPFLVAQFGSPEVMGQLVPTAAKFPKGSQRLCASRYVSVGTYNTEEMEPGKILLIDNNPGDHAWYDTIYSDPNAVYNRLQQIGVDINYNKHWNHGLEFRIFDWFPEALIPDLFRLLIWMLDESLLKGQLENPKKNKVWNDFLARAVIEGANTCMTALEVELFRGVLNTPFVVNMKIQDAYDLLWKTWSERWNWSTGTCTELMIRVPLDIPIKEKTIYNTLTPKSISRVTSTSSLVIKVDRETQTDIESRIDIIITGQSGQSEEVVIPQESETEQAMNELVNEISTAPIVTAKPWWCC